MTDQPLILLDPYPRSTEWIFDAATRARLEELGRVEYAFTLIELLVVSAIVAVLAGLLLPTVNVVRAAATQNTCMSNQRQVLMAIFAYADDNEGLTPCADSNVRVPPCCSTRNWYTNLLYNEYLPTASVVLPWSGMTPMRSPSLRWPNIVSCPAFRPPQNPTIVNGANTAYGVRWNVGVLTGNGEVFGGGGAASLDRLLGSFPFLSDTLNIVSSTSAGDYWRPIVIANNIAVHLAHRRLRAVVGYSDGRVAAVDRATLVSQGVGNAPILIKARP